MAEPLTQRPTPTRPRARTRDRLGAVLRRLAGAVFVLWAVATLTFFAVRLIPGDPAQAILGGPGSQTSPEALAAVRAEYGLDQPIWVQYLQQLGKPYFYHCLQQYKRTLYPKF